MAPLRYSTNLTLDGCYDHRAIIPDEDLHRHAAQNLAQADALLFGRVTYQMMEDAWRSPARTGVTPDWMQPWMLPFARTIDAAKKYVVSSTLHQVDWNAQLLPPADLANAVRQLKRESRNGLFVAGIKLAQALTELDLIDEYEFIVHPRLAGHGPTLFAVVVTHGLRNHRQEGPPELFRWVGEQYPLSYGLLYVHDDEHPAKNNEFVVYRLAHGKVTEFLDSLLSPFVPTVESPPTTDSSP